MKKVCVDKINNYDYHYYDGNLIKKIRYYSDTGNKHYEVYYKDSKTHNEDDKPATIYWYKDGQKICEYYYKNGNLHREGDKPAVIEWFGNGYMGYEKYYKNGIDVTENTLIRIKINRIKKKIA